MKLHRPWQGANGDTTADDPAKRREQLIAYKDRIKRQLEILAQPTFYPAPSNRNVSKELMAALVLVEYELGELDGIVDESPAPTDKPPT